MALTLGLHLALAMGHGIVRPPSLVTPAMHEGDTIRDVLEEGGGLYIYAYTHRP